MPTPQQAPVSSPAPARQCFHCQKPVGVVWIEQEDCGSSIVWCWNCFEKRNTSVDARPSTPHAGSASFSSSAGVSEVSDERA